MASRHVRRQHDYGPTRSTNVGRAIRIDGRSYEQHEPRRGVRFWVRVALVLIPMAAMVAWVWFLGAERRAIYGLPPDERAVVYADTMQAFEATCVPPRARPNEHCRSQASFLVNFADCDAHCRFVTAPLLHFRNR